MNPNAVFLYSRNRDYAYEIEIDQFSERSDSVDLISVYTMTLKTVVILQVNKIKFLIIE